MEEEKLPLWTRDFTIITIGSVISMIGNALSGFALSLMVLDYTQSPFLYAIYTILYTAPSVFMPIVSGTILDRVSRRKAIYTLDFISALLYLVAGVAIWSGFFSFPVFAAYVFLLGSIQAVYQVAYESFYPLLISKGNFSKAYSVSSFLESVIIFVVPLSTLVYKTFGIAPLLIGNAVSFLIAALFETQIKANEKYVEERKQEEGTKGASRMLQDTKEGFQYLASERGLLFVAVFFLFSSMGGGFHSVLGLPFMTSTFENGAYIYSLFAFFSIGGRSLMSVWHYRHKLPVSWKFTIAFWVYILINVCEGGIYYLPVWAMFLATFIAGVGGVTSWTIRISATQAYVPDEKKGRFNGAFNMLSMVGMLLGEAIAGFLTKFFPLRAINLGGNMVILVMAIVLIGLHKKDIAPIYNREQ